MKKKKNTQRRKTVKYALITAGILLALGAAAILGVYIWLAPYQNYDRIFPNVSYNGVELGGMTLAEAQSAIESNLSGKTFNLNVIFPDGSQYTLSPRQEVKPVDLGAVLSDAWQYGRGGGSSPFHVYRAVQAAKSTSYQIPGGNMIDYDAENLRSQVDRIVEQVTTKPEDSTGTGDSENKTVSVTPGHPGHTADAQAIFDGACEAYDTGNFNALLADYVDVPLDENQLTAMISSLYSKFCTTAAESRVSTDQETHSLTITKGTPGWVFDQQALADAVIAQAEAGGYQPVSAQMEEILPADIDVAVVSKSLVQDPTPVEYHDGALTGGEVGYTLDVEAAQAQVDALSWGESVTLTLEEVQPEHTVEEVREVLFRDVLGECHTAYYNNYNRTTNLRLACQEIDGIIMNPGRVFSFNTFVGERTAEKGYRTAIIYVDGEEETDDGGGVCQVASTIYDAALYADMEITDRATHQFMVTYVEGGLDATVYWGVQDFCFKNTSDYPIQIHAYLENGRVNVVINGTNDTGKYVTLDSYRTDSDAETVTYAAFQYVYASDGSLIEKRDLGEVTYDRE